MITFILLFFYLLVAFATFSVIVTSADHIFLMEKSTWIAFGILAICWFPALLAIIFDQIIEYLLDADW